MAENNTIHVVVIEDTEEIRLSLQTIINAEPGYRCTDTFASGDDALPALPQLQPDVVLIDIHMPGISGIECVKLLTPGMPRTQFVMFTVYQDDDSIYDALRSGALGYLLKKASPSEIVNAIRDVYQGGSPMSSEIARRVVRGISGSDLKHTASKLEILTDRENEILQLLAKGFLYKEIANQLSVSHETVKKHIQNIYKKLHVQNRTEAINKAVLR